MRLLKKIKDYLYRNEQEAIKEDYYRAKLCGEAKSVTYQIEGLVDSYCTVTAWANGEGYEVDVDDEKGNTKSISLHVDELDCMFACLNHLKHFGE